MKPLKNLFLAILVLLICQGCLPRYGAKSLLKGAEASLTSNKIAGNYQNGIDGERNATLWRYLRDSQRLDLDTTDLPSDVVRLQLSGTEFLNAQLIQNGEVKASLNIEGELNENYFMTKRKWLIIPFFPLFYQDFERRALLSKEGDSLVMVRGRYNGGWLLINGNGHGVIFTNKFPGVSN